MSTGSSTGKRWRLDGGDRSWWSDSDGRYRTRNAHLDEIFPGRSVREWASFRVARNADYDVDDDNVGDLLDAVAHTGDQISSFRRRKRNRVAQRSTRTPPSSAAMR